MKDLIPFPPIVPDFTEEQRHEIMPCCTIPQLYANARSLQAHVWARKDGFPLDVEVHIAEDVPGWSDHYNSPCPKPLLHQVHLIEVRPQSGRQSVLWFDVTGIYISDPGEPDGTGVVDKEYLNHTLHDYGLDAWTPPFPIERDLP